LHKYLSSGFSAQAWPITCCLGAVAGHVAGNVVGACRVWPKLANLNNAGYKRKFV